MTTPERVIVTGGHGFIGGYVVRALLASGREVAILDRPGTSSRHLDELGMAVPRLDAPLDDPDALGRCLTAWRPDACVHLAWYAEPGRYLEAPENIAALNATVALVRALVAVQCRSVVLAGTCAEYDADHTWLREDTPLRPQTLYAAAKASASMLAPQLAKGSDTHVAWARIFYPYGPYEDPRRVIPALIGSLLAERRFPASTGEQVRDYLHVHDVAAAFATLVDHAADGVFNVASGSPVTMRQLLETIGEQMGRRDLIDFGAVPARAWEPRRIVGEAAALRALGWEPRYTLDAGLAETIAWWRERR